MNKLFSTAVGRAVAKLVATAALSLVTAIFTDPTVMGWVLGMGGTSAVLSFVRDLLDESIPNHP